jgi:hypothetical protein
MINRQIENDELISLLISKSRQGGTEQLRIAITASAYDSTTKLIQLKYSTSDPTESVFDALATTSAQVNLANGGTIGQRVLVAKVGSSWVVIDKL